ncbi:hypothetical protein [Gymnodinialimonas ulvae]|uniref:hypothetical protein n=1 Tax=Gymnodinialimonas ulvae TaxID=3126504 RepID=UPI0030B2F65B
MKHLLLALPLAALATTAQAQGLDFSGNVSMGLQSTTINGDTEVSPIARLEGRLTYTMETDAGVTFVLAFDFDETLVNTPQMEFRPGHR